jgi:tetratricopeptide (TPR) repeat protein
MTFAPVEEGGLGLVYDNGRTRSVQEVWTDRRANCLGLTAFFVASCRIMGLEAGFAEAPGVSQWRKVGELIRNERHMVAVLENRPLGVLVMDFAPELRRSFYQVIPLGEEKALAMFHSNRAVEALDAGLVEEAFVEAQAGIAASPAVGVAWNVLGVVQRERQNLPAAEAAFRKALAVDPWGGSACGNLESLCQSQGREAEAETFRNLAVTLRAKDPYYHAFLAKEAMGRNDFKLARKELHQALKIYKQEPEFYVLMAQVEIQSGEQRDAEWALEQAKKWASPVDRARMESKLARIRNPGN